MTDISKNNIFPTISKIHIRDTFILYNNFVKNATKYQSAMAALMTAVNDLSHSYEDFINYAPMKAIIDSSGQQIEIYNSIKIYRILYESFKKLGEFLDRDFANPLNDDFKSMQEKFNDKKLEKTLKMEEKHRTKSFIPGVLPEPSNIQRGLFQQYISAVNFVTHKTRKLQFYEIHVFERMVQGMLNYDDVNNYVFSLDRCLSSNGNASNYDNSSLANLYINEEMPYSDLNENDTYHQPLVKSPVNTVNSDSNVFRENDMGNNVYNNKNGSTYQFRKSYYHHRHTNSTPNIKYWSIPSSENNQNVTYKQNNYSIPMNNANTKIESKNNEDDDKKENKLKLNIKSALKNDLKKNLFEIKNKLHKRHSSPITSKNPASSLDNESNENCITTIGKNDSLSKLQNIISQEENSNDDEEFIVISKKKIDNLIKTGKVHSIEDILKKSKHASTESSSEEKTEDVVEAPREMENPINNVPNGFVNETPKLIIENENIPSYASSQLPPSTAKVSRRMNKHIRSSSYGGFSQSHIRGTSSNLALKHYPSIVPNGYSTMNPHQFLSAHSSPLLSVNEDITPLSKTSNKTCSIQDLLNNWPNIEEVTPTEENRPVFTRKNSLPIYDRKNPLTTTPATIDFIPAKKSSPSSNDNTSNNTVSTKESLDEVMNTTYATENEASSMMINDPTGLIFSKFNTSSESINHLEGEIPEASLSPIVNDNENLPNTPTFEPKTPLRGVSLAYSEENCMNVEEVKQEDEIEEHEPVLPIRGISLHLDKKGEKKNKINNNISEENFTFEETDLSVKENDIELESHKNCKTPVRNIITNISSKFSQKLNSMFHNNETTFENSLSRKLSVQSDTYEEIIRQKNSMDNSDYFEVPRRNSSASLKTRKGNPSATFSRNANFVEDSINKKQTVNDFATINESEVISTPILNLKYEAEEDNEETPTIEKFPERPVFSKPQCPNTSINAPITPVFPNTKLCDILMNHEEPSSFNIFNEQDGNNDIIVISNPLVEVINNKNLAEFKDDLPDECQEFRISKNEEYMSFDLCQNAVEIESAVGSIIDPDEDTSRLEMLNNDSSLSFNRSNTSLIYKESDSIILSTPKHNEGNLYVIQEIAEQEQEQQPQFESNKEDNHKMKKYVALYPYNARDDRELSFQRADIINVRKEQGEWVYGFKENLINDEEIKFGWVPKSYIKSIIS